MKANELNTKKPTVSPGNARRLHRAAVRQSQESATMAKKLASDTVQTTLEGEGFPEKPPAAVVKACRRLREAINDKTTAVNEEKEARQSLLEKMQEAELPRVKVDDKIYEVNHEDKVKVKAIKGDEGEEA